MNHSALSLLLLFGIGMAPVMGFLGGGSVYYGKGDPEIQKSAGETDGTKAKGTNGTTQQKTAENLRAYRCRSADESTCFDNATGPAK
jgi:hypothetical protein